jgi:hypothetical protein
MPISDDEYITMGWHATMNWWDVLTTGQSNIVWAPNNHVLNTIFIKLEIALFGKKDWAVRLHILAAFVFAYYYAVKIIQLLTPSRIRQLLYLLILFFNPYLLDFYGIARGYAMSMAGFMAAFYYFLMFTETLSLKYLRNIFLGMLVAVWSNFSALYLLVLLVVLICVEIYSNKNKINAKRYLAELFMANAAIVIIILLPLIRTIRSEESFGGKTGLFQDCVVNYVNQFIHQNSQLNRHALFAAGWKYIEVAGILFLMGWILLQLASFLFSTNQRLVKMHLTSLFLVIGVAIIAKTLFVIWNVPYPTARTELLFSIPFYLSACIAFERIISRKKHFIVIPWIIIAALIWHFSYSVTFENTIEWWQNGDAKRIVRFLKEELKENKPDKILNLGVEAWQFPSVAFYTETEFKDVMITSWTDLSVDGHYDYLFVPFHLRDKVWQGYEPIKEFKHGVMYKRRSGHNFY